MRILQVVHTFPPHSYAGAEKVAFQISHALAAEHEMHVFYPVVTGAFQTITSSRRDRVNTHELSLIGYKQMNLRNFHRATTLASTYENSAVVDIFAKLLHEIAPDMVHFHHLINLSADLIPLAKNAGLPTVLTLHDYWFLCPTVQLLRHDGTVCKEPQAEVCRTCWTKKRSRSLSEKAPQLPILSTIAPDLLRQVLAIRNPADNFEKRNMRLREALSMVDQIIAPSRFLGDLYTSFGIEDQKIIHMQNGYDRQAFSAKSVKRANNKIVFGYLGRVVPSKGIHVMIDAALNLPPEQVEMLIFGGYDDKSSYWRELAELTQGAEHIRFMGRTDQVKEAFAKIDVLIFPSIWYENCPLTLAERRLASVPVIASRIGAIPEFVDEGVDGVLFKPGDSQDLLDKMRLFVDDPQKIEQFAKRITDQPPTIEAQANKMSQIYERLVGEHARKR